MRGRNWLLAGAAASLLWTGGSAAFAQETVQTAPAAIDAPIDPREARIRALEEQLQDIAGQLADLKAATSSSFRDVRTAASAQPQVTFANGRPQLASADGGFKVAIRSVVQFDAAKYDTDPFGPSTDLSSGTNFRRARLGIDATVYKDWNLALWGEFGGSGGETALLNQAFIEYAGWTPGGLANPLRLRIGAWATPTGLEDATSNTESLFLERAASAELVRNFAGGDGRTGVGAFANGTGWYASAVFTGAVVGTAAAPEFDEQTGFLARLALRPLTGADYDLHIGGSFSTVFDAADTAAGPAVAETLRLRERPELRVDGARLVDTGAIASGGLNAYGAELGFSWKNLHAAGEYFWIDLDRRGTGPAAFDPGFSGWYVQGAWTLTGERHQWQAASGGFRGIRPAKPFDASKGEWGAFEIAARYSVLDLNDREGLPGAAAPAGGIRGGEQKITTVGLNWHPNNVVRFLLDYQWIDVDRLSAAGLQTGPDANVVSLRSQFAF